jgi:magnesium chelatase family protein
MSLAVVKSRALDGLAAPEVQVEVHLANGLPSFTLVGLADTEVKESRERVRAALQQSGFAFPHNKRITVNLAPADLPKESGRFDLPIALGILAADGQIDAAPLAACRIRRRAEPGRRLRPVRGALALALALQRAPPAARRPHPGAAGRQRGRGARVRGVACAVPPPAGRWCARCCPAMRQPAAAAACPADSATAACADLRDVRGQAAAKRALEIAAAGAHSLLMVGPPGSGKSMLAQRLPGLLPPMDEDEALASAALPAWRRVASTPPAGGSARCARRTIPPVPWRWWAAAHRRGRARSRWRMAACSSSTNCRSSRAPALEALREPLETGRITISRAARQARFPAASSWWRR